MIFPVKRGQTPVSKISSSKLVAALAIVTFIAGAVAVVYSASLFLSGSNQGDNAPSSLRLSQWSGYIAGSDIHNFSSVVTSVSASWTIPQVQPSENDTFSGVWVGIGGYGEDTLIQAGTEQEYIDGGATYYAWYELIPDYLVRIQNLHVRPGDTITVSISLVEEETDSWSITVTDVTRNQQFQKDVVYNSSMRSAEWIVERPKVNGDVSTLANFGTVTFTDCQATVDGVKASIGNFSNAQLVMHDDEETPLVSVSPLQNDGSSFTVSYLDQPSPTTLGNVSTVQAFVTLRRDALSKI